MQVIKFVISLLLLVVNAACASKSLTIKFIDVGEGASTLLISPDKKSILIDTGNLITGHAAGKALKESSIKKLDHLVITHPDKDHAGGIFYLAQEFSPKSIYDNGEDVSAHQKRDYFFRWYGKLLRDRKNYKPLSAGDKIVVGKLILRVLWPKRPSPVFGFNPNSLVVMVEYGKFRAFLAGDLVQESEEHLLHLHPELNAQILQVAHHGSKYGSGEKMLAAISPRRCNQCQP